MKKKVLLLAAFVVVHGSIYGSTASGTLRTAMRRLSVAPKTIPTPKPPVSNMRRYACTGAKVVGGLFIAANAINLGILSIIGPENLNYFVELPFNERRYSVIALGYIQIILNKESTTNFEIKHKRVKSKLFSQYDKNSPELQKVLRFAIKTMYLLKKDHFSWIEKRSHILENMIAQDLGIDVETLIEKQSDGKN